MTRLWNLPRTDRRAVGRMKGSFGFPGLLVLAGGVCLSLLMGASETLPRPFVLRVVDDETGRGVPLVELKTTSRLSLWTDSAGVAVFEEPGLMDREVFFEIKSHGYEFPADGFGYRGRAVRTTPGGSVEFRIHRLNVAERLYRLTGAGIYRDSVRAGLPVPLREPVLNGQVMGQDTAVASPFQGRLYWFWGDTDRPAHPLGHFGASGAVVDWPGKGGLDPGVGVDFHYYTDRGGFSRPTCPDPAEGMRWIESLMEVRDPAGEPKLLARYAVMRDLGYAKEWVLGAFEPGQGVFRPVARYDVHRAHTAAHPFRVSSGGQEYWYLFPTLRVKADWASVTNPVSFESYTCLHRPGASARDKLEVERTAEGRAMYRWRAGLAPFTPDVQEAARAKGELAEADHWCALRDVETGRALRASPVHGSVRWNAFRQRWLALCSGEPGDVWYAEADTPTGPWVYAQRVIQHDRYNFYNPVHHDFLDQDFGRRIYLEGTYTTAFSAASTPTPRYDYNQIMYRLDLQDARLFLPAPVYRLAHGEAGEQLAMRDAVAGDRRWGQVLGCAFHAWPPDRRRSGLVPIYQVGQEGAFQLATQPVEGQEAWAQPLFYAFDATAAPAEHPLDGMWKCEGTLPSGSWQDFGWELHEEAGQVRGRFDPDSAFRVATLEGGTFRDGQLEMRVSHAGARYRVVGRFAKRALSGTWQRLDEEESGQWKGRLTDAQPRLKVHDGVVRLFEYVHPTTKRRIYRTEAEGEGEGFMRVARPLCRVLVNPQRALAIDPEGRAVEAAAR